MLRDLGLSDTTDSIIIVDTPPPRSPPTPGTVAARLADAGRGGAGAGRVVEQLQLAAWLAIPRAQRCPLLGDGALGGLVRAGGSEFASF